jgi:hypothetical protein
VLYGALHVALSLKARSIPLHCGAARAGFHDNAYRQRREEIVAIAAEYHHGMEIPRIKCSPVLSTSPTSTAPYPPPFPLLVTAIYARIKRPPYMNAEPMRLCARASRSVPLH